MAMHHKVSLIADRVNGHLEKVLQSVLTDFAEKVLEARAHSEGEFHLTVTFESGSSDILAAKAINEFLDLSLKRRSPDAG